MVKEKKAFTMKSLYLYLASFAALLFFLFGTVLTATGVMELIYPAGYYQTYLEFRQSIGYLFEDEGAIDLDLNLDIGVAQTKDMAMVESGIAPDTEEVRAMYEEQLEAEMARTRAFNMRDLAGSVTAMVLGLFFWLFFWKKTKNL